MKLLLPLFIAIAGLVFTATASADRVYQWKNDEGVTQFGSQPPRGREYRELRTQTGHSEPVDYQALYGPAEEPEQEAPTQERTEGPSDEEFDEACRLAEQNLETIERGGRIVELDEDGERRFLGEEELEERAQQARQTRDLAC